VENRGRQRQLRFVPLRRYDPDDGCDPSRQQRQLQPIADARHFVAPDDSTSDNYRLCCGCERFLAGPLLEGLLLEGFYDEGAVLPDLRQVYVQSASAAGVPAHVE